MDISSNNKISFCFLSINNCIESTLVYHSWSLELNKKWSTVRIESLITHYSNSVYCTNKTVSILLEPSQMSMPYQTKRHWKKAK